MRGEYSPRRSDGSTIDRPGVQVLFNVSTLLGEPLGSTHRLRVEGERARVPGEQYNAAAEGDIEMVRTPTGILVRAQLSVSPEIQCGRCLRTFIEPVAVDFDEEFVLERDPATGEAVEGLSGDDFRIDERQHLDLSEAVRQYEQSARPLRPVCRPECAGLCSTCGRDLNEGPCGCPRVEADNRWSGLATLAERLKTEESGGST